MNVKLLILIRIKRNDVLCLKLSMKRRLGSNIRYINLSCIFLKHLRLCWEIVAMITYSNEMKICIWIYFTASSTLVDIYEQNKTKRGFRQNFNIYTFTLRQCVSLEKIHTLRFMKKVIHWKVDISSFYFKGVVCLWRPSCVGLEVEALWILLVLLSQGKIMPEREFDGFKWAFCLRFTYG